MDEELDRRGFLRRAGATSLGFAGMAGGVAAQDGDGQGGGEGQDGGPANPGGEIETVKMVVPAVDILDPDFANRIVLVSEPNRPGFRPADVCFPEVPESADSQWHSYDATIIDPTETGGLFGDDDNSIGGFEDSVVFVDDPVPPRSLYRIVGGDGCDDGEFYQIRTHELTSDLYDFFDIATEILDGDEEDAPA